ncbi:MAG: biopolymer transporter ExbD [Methylococcales bacterium]|nr:biopolymer transporter ExbD [Methylococcales bacterium]
MAFKPQGESADAMSEINVTPLVDVMLVLVIILLVTAPLVTQSVHMKLPETAETTADIDKQPFQLAIDAKNEITLNKIPYANLVDLETTLKTELAKNPDMEIHLHADQSIVYGKVAELMATVQHAGIVKMAFVTTEQ